MDCTEIRKLLEEYKIADINTLENILGKYYDSKSDNDLELLEVGEDYNCLKANSFPRGIPDCRKIVVIWGKFYKNSGYKTKESFVKLLHTKYLKESNKPLGISRFKTFLGCKGCEDREANSKKQDEADSILIDILCHGLKVKLNQDEIFKINTYKIVDFEVSLKPITRETYKPLFEEEEREKMEQKEKNKLYKVIHVMRSKFKENLSKPSNIDGSDEYKLNLALEAFNRKLDDEALDIINGLKDSKEYKENHTYLQLKAKLLSNKEQDKEAIEVLNKLIKIQNPNIEIETNNLLGASIKREAYREYLLYSREDILITKFEKSKSTYENSFNMNNDYYPAINIVYLEMMLSIIRDDDIEKTINNLKVFWNNVRFEEKDYWSYLSNIEFLIITREYNKAREKIAIFIKKLNEDDITEFKSFATNRQLKMYMNFYEDKELNDIQNYLIECFTEQ